MKRNANDYNKLLDYILVLRTLVLALGEITEPPWWRTKFMSNVGLSFLQRIYPRTNFQVALNSAGKAARDIHDQSVGKVGVFHLFRLPPGLEVDIHSYQTGENCFDTSELITMLEDQSKLFQALSNISKSDTSNDILSGAVNIGVEAECYMVDTYKKMAAIYFQAFKNGKQTYPYMSTERVPK